MKPDSSPARLIRLREHVQASQRDMAQVFGVAPGAIAMWEKGTRKISGPGLVLLERLEQEFGLVSEAADASLDSAHLSRLFTERVLAASRAEKERFQNVALEIIDTHLARASGTRRLQVLLIDKVLDALADAKGLPLKIVQLASFLDLGLSLESRIALANAQNSLSAMPIRQLTGIFIEDFGKPPEELFARWNPRPIAAASIGQVHEAALPSGEKIAVKVQYPNIHRKMSFQTRPIRLLSALVALVRNDYADMLGDFVSKLREECDYRMEARSHRAYFEAFRDDPQIHIPKLHEDFCSARVLTTEFVEGRNFHEFLVGATRTEKDLAGGIIHRFCYEASLRHGLIQGDLNPGNYIFHGDRVTFLDFGRVVRPGEAELRKTRAYFRALHDNDPEAMQAAMREADYVRDWRKFNFTEFWDTARTQLDYELSPTPTRFTKEYVRRIWRAANAFKQRSQLTMNAHFFWPVFTSATLWGLLAELEAEYDWNRNALNANPPLPES